MQVEQRAGRVGVRDLDEHHGDSAELAARGEDVGRERVFGQQVLEQRALGLDVTAQVEGRVPEGLVDRVALLLRHNSSPGVVKARFPVHDEVFWVPLSILALIY